MKKYVFCLFIFLISFALTFAKDDWQVLKSTHFVVYYKNAPVEFIEDLTKKAEDYYNQIADNLGFRRYDFWLWDKRAKIYIYDNVKDYQLATAQPAWSSGCAMIKQKIIHTFPYAEGFSQTILPHELGHIIFREFVGFDNPAVPLWLDEGVAASCERSRYIIADKIVKEAMDKLELMSMDRLFNFNLALEKDTKAVNLFYAEAVSLVNYLIKNFGQDRFVLFCQGLRDKKDLVGALRFAYGFSKLKDLESAWQDYLEKD